MLITSPGYMQTRSLEVGLALAMFATGMVFLLPGDTLAAPIFAVLRKHMSPLTEDQLGLLLIAAALVRWIALYVNSHHCSTPLVRFAGCLFGAFLWVSSASGIATINGHFAAVPWALGLMLVFAIEEAYSAYRTGLDADALDSLGRRRRAHERRRAARDHRRAEQACAELG